MAATFEARRLTAAGMQFHYDHFNPTDELGKRGGHVDRAPDPAVIDSDEYSEPLPFKMVFPAVLPENKLFAARAIVRAFGQRFNDHLHDAELWNYLTLRYRTQIVPEGEKLAEQAAYTVYPAEQAYQHSSVRIFQYRHRLWGPAFVYSRFGESARVMLTGPLHQMSGVLDAAFYSNVLAPGVIKTLDAMYFDDESGELVGKVRLSKNLGGNLREGSIRDCIAQINQIATTRALHLMTPEQILSSLPESEFGAHIEAARLKLGLFAKAA